MTITEKLKEYDITKYIKDVETNGLENIWNDICNYVLKYGETEGLINIRNFGELYEIGLSLQDKLLKKKSGQYYTPDDVALVMSKWLDECPGDNICDVGCGTGKLILTYLDYISYDKAVDLLKKGKIYLYDFDKIALKICKTSLMIKYGVDLKDKIHDIHCDFLSESISLPKNCKTISNPPYSTIKDFNVDWEKTDILNESHELYSAFMEKIFTQSNSTVIITPYSFISGTKFYSLRKLMCEIGNGFILSFDNVPGNIFCGKKHGIFNTNTANSVRAAITVVRQDKNIKGYKVSPMIRFKNEERNELLNCDILEDTMSYELQIINNTNKTFKKIEKSLNEIYLAWVDKSTYKVKDVLSQTETKYFIDMPNTCRYNTTASSKKLNRTGKITLNILDEDAYYFLYCFINSSFAYWWWRIYDGGITYPIGLLKEMPLPLSLLTDEDRMFFKEIGLEMMMEENKYIKTKKNAGKKQENIKFPEEYKNKINQRILKILGFDYNSINLDIIHNNRFFYEVIK